MAMASTAGMVAGCGGGGILVRCSGCTCSRSLPCFASSRIPGPNLSIYHTQFPLKTHLKLYRSPKLAGAADSTQSSSIVTANADKTVIPDSEFTLAKVSFGVVGLGLGVGLLSCVYSVLLSIINVTTILNHCQVKEYEP